MEIRLPHTSEERLAASTLAEREYRYRDYVDQLDPLDANDTVLIAVYERRVIGTISVAMRSAAKRTPTEGYFGFNAETLFPQLMPEQFMELGRLAVSHEEAAVKMTALRGLIAAAWLWGDARHIRVAIASLKPTLQRLLTGLGIVSITEATSDQLVPGSIPTKYRGYFFPAKKYERPIAVSMHLPSVRIPILSAPEVINESVTFSLQVVHSNVVDFPIAYTTVAAGPPAA